MQYDRYSKEGLDVVKACNFLTDSDLDVLAGMQDELQNTFEKKQRWRTETEMRVSVLNDIKFPTRAAKYWQAVREQAVFYENLITLSFEYRRNNVQIKRTQRDRELSNCKFEVEGLQIDLEECLFKKKNMEMAAKDRMREIKLWSQIKAEQDDGSFDTTDVNTNQLVSYAKRYLLETAAADQPGVAMSPSEARNLSGQTITMLRACNEEQLNEAASVLSPQMRQRLLPQLGLQDDSDDN